MPRLVTERLEGYAFAVAHAAGDGDQAIVAQIQFVDNPQRPTHTVTIPLTEQGRRGLIAQLTGGLVIGHAG